MSNKYLLSEWMKVAAIQAMKVRASMMKQGGNERSLFHFLLHKNQSEALMETVGQTHRQVLTEESPKPRTFLPRGVGSFFLSRFHFSQKDFWFSNTLGVGVNCFLEYYFVSLI